MIELRHTIPATTDTQDAYDSLYSNEAVTQHWDSFFDWILDLLQPRPGTRLLDVSCGTGRMLHLTRLTGVEPVGIDFSRVAVEQAQVYGPAGIADGEQLPFAARSFDYVTNLGSLEHFEDMAGGVREMARVLKPGGTCCILVPNTYGLLWTVWHAKNTGDVYADTQPLQRYGTRQQWTRLLEANGLAVQRTVAYELPPPRTMGQWAYYLRHPKVHLTKLVLWRLLPVNLASMFVFLCTPTADTA